MDRPHGSGDRSAAAQLGALDPRPLQQRRSGRCGRPRELGRAARSPDPRRHAGIDRHAGRSAPAGGGRGRRRADEPAAPPQRRRQLPRRVRPPAARHRLRLAHRPRGRGLRRDDAPRRAARQQLVRPAAVDGPVGPDGGQPDPRPSRRAAAGLARQARPPRDRGREQPVRPDPLRRSRAARDGAPDRPAAAAGAARGAHRQQLLLVAAPSGAPLHQPRRLARLRLRQLRGRPGEGAARPGRRAGQGDRRGRLRPAPDLRRQAVRARALRRRADPRRGARQRGGGDAARQGARVARRAAVQPAPARCARAARAADVRARLPVRRLGPGDRQPRRAATAPRRRIRCACAAPAPSW